MRLRLLEVASLALVLCLASGALAGPITESNPNWYEFAFGAANSFATTGAETQPSAGGNSQFLDNPPWTFTSADAVALTITDAFQQGDSFSVFDNDILVGSTPPVASMSDLETNPAVTVLDPSYSHGAFVLAPGSHSITIRVDVSPHDAGAAYFRTDAVPEPTALAATLLVGAGACRRRRRQAGER